MIEVLSTGNVYVACTSHYLVLRPNSNNLSYWRYLLYIKKTLNYVSRGANIEMHFFLSIHFSFFLVHTLEDILYFYTFIEKKNRYSYGKHGYTHKKQDCQG